MNEWMNLGQNQCNEWIHSWMMQGTEWWMMSEHIVKWMNECLNNCPNSWTHEWICECMNELWIH